MGRPSGCLRGVGYRYSTPLWSLGAGNPSDSSSPHPPFLTRKPDRLCGPALLSSFTAPPARATPHSITVLLSAGCFTGPIESKVSVPLCPPQWRQRDRDSPFDPIQRPPVPGSRSRGSRTHTARQERQHSRKVLPTPSQRPKHPAVSKPPIYPGAHNTLAIRPGYADHKKSLYTGPRQRAMAFPGP